MDVTVGGQPDHHAARLLVGLHHLHLLPFLVLGELPLHLLDLRLELLHRLLPHHRPVGQRDEEHLHQDGEEDDRHAPVPDHPVEPAQHDEHRLADGSPDPVVDRAIDAVAEPEFARQAARQAVHRRHARRQGDVRGCESIELRVAGRDAGGVVRRCGSGGGEGDRAHRSHQEARRRAPARRSTMKGEFEQRLRSVRFQPGDEVYARPRDGRVAPQQAELADVLLANLV